MTTIGVGLQPTPTTPQQQQFLDIYPSGPERWTPIFRPVVKLDLSRSAQDEKEQIDETKTQTV